ncbi:MAG: PLP-dependent aminotransferase family protein [Ruminococcaceae bacterium]|nr:PLP-dependent aminotransferase family protein [Oscillospiraceae bacterium]
MNFELSTRMGAVDSSAVAEILKSSVSPDVISLAGGNPDPALFPNDELADIAGEILRKMPIQSLQYGKTEGYPQLIEKIAERLSRVEGIDCSNDSIIITAGATQAIELTTKVLINEGDTVIAENPSFLGAFNAFRSYGANIVGIDMHDDGMDLDALEKAIQENENVKLLYVIPSFQNPMGTTMSLEKRKALYEIIRKYKLVTIEDNPYGDLTFDGERVPTLKSMDTEDLIVYCGSFSKIVAPGLRVGYALCNKELAENISAAKQLADVHSPLLPQIMVSNYMEKYDLDELIDKMRHTYAHKCRTMLDAINKYFPEGVICTKPNGGLFIWCDLGHGIDTYALAKKASEHKVSFVPGNVFMVDSAKKTSTLRLNYSTMSDENIVEGIKRLGELIKSEIG